MAVDADFEGYRELFLAGAEAAHVFGERAEDYLDNRDLDELEDALVTIGALIPDGSHFGGAETTGPSKAAIKVVPPDGEPYLVAIGKFSNVGGVFRIQQPETFK